MMHAQDEEEPYYRPLHEDLPPLVHFPTSHPSIPLTHLKSDDILRVDQSYRSMNNGKTRPKKPSPSPSPSTELRRHDERTPLLPDAFASLGRRKFAAFALPIWAYAFVHVVLGTRPLSYLPQSFLRSLSWDGGLVGGGSGLMEDGTLLRGSGDSVEPADIFTDTTGAIVELEYEAQPPSSPNEPGALPPELARRVDQHPYNLLRDVSDLPVNLDLDLPYFWHIHKSGGSTMKHVMYCLGRTQTRRIEEEGCSDSGQTLHVCRREFGTVINADASSPQGIERLINMKLAERYFPEIEGTKSFVVDTSRVYEAMPIFTPYRRGRLFALFRDPVERAVSKYHYIKIATWEKNYKPEVKHMTMMEFAQSKLCYNNWMVRRLVNKMQDDLTADDLALAKEILRRKVLVLFTDDMAGAAERVRQYFLWSDEALDLTDEQKNCLVTHIYLEPMNATPHPPLDPDSDEWAVIREKNLMDIELVSYARELYLHQGEMIAKIIRGGTYGTKPPEGAAATAAVAAAAAA